MKKALAASADCSLSLWVFFPQAEAARESKQNPMIQRNSSFASSHEVWKYICELGISKVSIN